MPVNFFVINIKFSKSKYIRLINRIDAKHIAKPQNHIMHEQYLIKSTHENPSPSVSFENTLF